VVVCWLAMSKLAEFCQKVPGLRGLYNFLARVHIRGVERELRKYGELERQTSKPVTHEKNTRTEIR